eukprot:m.80218 g.80218  ORF g.80218 m.80218 type:complete len:160 (+) comp16291_c0_seq25:2202-2681(+)
MHRRESLTQTFPCFSPNRLRPPPQFLPRGSFFGVWYFTHSSMLFQDFTRAGYHIATIAYVASTIVVAIFVQDLSIPAEFSGIIIVVICIFFPGVLKMKVGGACVLMCTRRWNTVLHCVFRWLELMVKTPFGGTAVGAPERVVGSYSFWCWVVDSTVRVV